MSTVAVIGTGRMGSAMARALVDGQIRKQDFKLAADLTGPRRLVAASRNYLVGQVTPQEGWLPRAVRA